MNAPTYDDADEVGVEFEAGRRSADGTWSPDWVVLSGCSAMAFKLYQLMRLRLNRKRRDSRVWPSGATLAVMLGLERSDSVSRYTKELEELGAITIRGERMPRRNVYIVHDIPEPDYAGPMALEEWDGDPDNKLKIAAIRRSEREKRERARAKKGKNPQVSLDTGSSRCQEERTGPGTAKSRYQGTAKSRDHDPAKSRDHSLQEPLRSEPPPPTPTAPVPAAVGAEPDREEEDPTPDNPDGTAATVLDSVLDRALTDKRRTPGGKSRATLVGDVAAAMGAGWHPFDLVTALGDPLDGVHTVYGTLRYRLRELGPPPARSAGTGGKLPWCGDPLCDEGTRRRSTSDGDDAGRCPECHPVAAGTADKH